MVKRYAPRLLLVLCIALVMGIAGCASKPAADDKYASLDTGRNVMIIKDIAFEEAEKLKDEEISSEISEVVYIAKFGAKEYKSVKSFESKRSDGTSYNTIFFEDADKKYYAIVYKDSKLQMTEIPGRMYDGSYAQPIFEHIDENKINDYMDFASIKWDVKKRAVIQNPYTVVGHEVVDGEDGKKELVVYTQEGLKYTFKENNGKRKWNYNSEEYDMEQYLAEKGKPSIAPEQLKGIIASASSGTIVKYKEGRINEDIVNDYVVLVRNDKDPYSGWIMVIDGKNGNVAASMDIILGSEVAELDVWNIKSADTRFIYFYTHDGQPYNYLLHYTSNKLVNTFNEFDISKTAGYDSQKGLLNMYFTPIGRTIGFTVDAVSDVSGGGFAYTQDAVKGINGEEQLEIMSYLIFTPGGDNEIGELIHRYEWKDGKWNLVGVDAKAYNGLIVEGGSGTSDTGAATREWFQNGVLTVTKDSLTAIFNLKLDDVLRMYGEPDYREGDYNLMYDSLQYNFETKNKLGGIMFGSGNNMIFDTKIGMTTQQIKNSMGKPEEEVQDAEGFDGVENVLVYNISGHEVMIGITGDRSVWCIIKGKY